MRLKFTREATWDLPPGESATDEDDFAGRLMAKETEIEDIPRVTHFQTKKVQLSKVLEETIKAS